MKAYLMVKINYFISEQSAKGRDFLARMQFVNQHLLPHFRIYVPIYGIRGFSMCWF